jgi:hypothetical protein
MVPPLGEHSQSAVACPSLMRQILKVKRVSFSVSVEEDSRDKDNVGLGGDWVSAWLL